MNPRGLAMTKILRYLMLLLAVFSLAATSCGSDDERVGVTAGSAAGGSGGPWTCVDPNTPEPAPGTELVFSWGGGSTLAGIEKHVKPLVEGHLGFEMTVLGNSSSKTMAQIIGQGGAGDFDIVLTSFGPLTTGRGEDVLSTINFDVLPETSFVPEEFHDPAGEDLALTVTHFAYGLAYNEETLAERGLPIPESVEAVLDPIYADLLGLYLPPFAGAVSQIAIINSVLGGPPDDLTLGIEALAGLDAAQSIENSAQMDAAFAAGDVGMYFSASATAQTFIDKGLPVGMAYSPAYGSGIYAVIPKNPRHPGAACVFVNWLASPEGMEALQEVNGNLPTRREGVVVRPDTIMAKASKEEILSYPDLRAGAPSSEATTEQWNKARG